MVTSSARFGPLSDYTANYRPVLSSQRAPHRNKRANFRHQHPLQEVISGRKPQKGDRYQDILYEWSSIVKLPHLTSVLALYSVGRDDDRWMLNCKGLERKRSWYPRYYYGISLQRHNKILKILIARIRADDPLIQVWSVVYTATSCNLWSEGWVGPTTGLEDMEKWRFLTLPGPGRFLTLPSPGTSRIYRVPVESSPGRFLTLPGLELRPHCLSAP
jgi:hypothetical protein